ncbi:MAG: hypothetical protein ACXVEF_27285 [Polyangiales bacterium]
MKRHRPSEPFTPRPSDLIATRLRLVAALVREAKLEFEAEGTRWNGESLQEAAEDQARVESELVAGFTAFREIWARHGELHRVRSAALARATELVTPMAPKHELRLCRLRRPPLAKVEIAIAEARRRTG